MKNKIVLSYRFIILVYYLLAFLIVIMNINHLERVLIYSLILIVLFGIVMSIYIMSIPKLLLKSEYLKLYDLQLDNKVKNPLFKIMYLILNEKYEEALELSKKVTSQQKDIGYIMKLYYRIICLEHLEKENELNDCINEMVEFNDQIHYVKEIKDKYKK